MSAINTDIGPYAIVPLWLVESGVSGNAIKVYAYLAAAHADRDDNTCFPSRNFIARKLGVSSDTVDRAKKELVELGAVEVKGRVRTDGSQTSNLYTLATVRPPGRKSAEAPLRKSAEAPSADMRNDKQESEEQKSAGTNGLDLHLIEFNESLWPLYPRHPKPAKKRALAAYRSARKRASAEAILEGFTAAVALWQSERRANDKIPYLSTWLNGDEWETEAAPAKDASVYDIGIRRAS